MKEGALALSPRLELRQGQSLVITPQLQQAIKLLQLSNLELETYVEGELERNPLLAREETDQPEADRGDDRAEPEFDASADFSPGGAAEAEIDARHDDIYTDAAPGDRATGDAGDAADAGVGGLI